MTNDTADGTAVDEIPPIGPRRVRLGRTLGGILTGVMAGVFSLGVAQLVAGIFAPEAAPLVALGDVVVNHVPPWLKDFAVTTFGTHDKQVLLANALHKSPDLNQVMTVQQGANPGKPDEKLNRPVASNRAWPPTSVASTLRPAMRSGLTAVGSSDSTTKSASLPGVIVPRLCSAWLA